jgi:hypothetical protein
MEKSKRIMEDSSSFAFLVFLVPKSSTHAISTCWPDFFLLSSQYHTPLHLCSLHCKPCWPMRPVRPLWLARWTDAIDLLKIDSYSCIRDLLPCGTYATLRGFRVGNYTADWSVLTTMCHRANTHLEISSRPHYSSCQWPKAEQIYDRYDGDVAVEEIIPTSTTRKTTPHVSISNISAIMVKVETHATATCWSAAIE